LESARNTETWQAQNYIAQKYTEGPEGDQHDLVRSQKSGSGLTEMESNCGRPMPPMGQRGLDDVPLVTDESVTRVDSSVPLMHHDPSDLGSLIQITPKERTPKKQTNKKIP